MSAFGGKADMTIGTCPLSWSLSGVKQTSLVAAHMSACDPNGHRETIKDDFRPLLVAPPYLVADFLGDHSIADMEVVQ